MAHLSNHTDRTHALRVAVKRLRAQLRLMESLERARSRSLDRKLRKIGRVLSPVRDREVQNAWLKKNGFSTLPRLKPPVSIHSLETRVYRLGLRVEVARARADLSVKKEGQTLEKSRKKAVKAWKKAKHTDRDEDFHEWRKRTKDLQYQLDFLDRRARRKRVRRLAHWLGKFHDAVLIETLLKNDPSVSHSKTIRLAKRDKRKSRATALRLAKRALE